MRILLFTLLCLLLFSQCKEDKPLIKDDSIEGIYFQDYEIPNLKWGYLDTSGRVVVEPIYDDVRDMTKNLVAANLKGKWGFIDKNGSTIIGHDYKQVLDFNSEGDRVFVQDFNNGWLLLDGLGKVVDSLKYDTYKKFVDDLCAVSKNGLWGIINKSGKEIISPSFLFLEIINDDYIISKKYDKYQLINNKGESLSDLTFDRITIAGEKVLRLKENGQYFFSDYDLKRRSQMFDRLSLFNGDGAVGRVNGKTYLIDEEYIIIVELPYKKVQSAGEGKWKYKSDERWGLLDAKGDKLTDPDYFLLNQYQEDFILYSTSDDNWGYLDNEGEIFIGANFPIAWEYKNGFARFMHRKGIGFINKSKEIVIDKRMYEVRDFYNGLARFQSLR